MPPGETMATGAEVAAAKAVCSCLNCCCNLLGKDIVQTDKNVSDLRSEVGKLSSMRRDVQSIVETRQLGSSGIEVVHNWLKRSDAVDKEVSKLSDKYDAMCLPRLNLWRRYRISKRASRKLKKTKKLIQERYDSLPDTLTATTAASSMKHELQEKQIETMVVGMDPYLEKALEYIDGDEVGVVGICGMGGVGKTTLLRKIHGEFLPGKERSKSFDKVMWAVVFKKSTATVDVMHNDIVRLQNDIARELGLDLTKIQDVEECSDQVLEMRALPIYEYLSNKNFLLLLDDLWSPLELRSIGVPNPTITTSSSKHKVVLTSRSKDICGQMQAAPGLIDVHCLDDIDAWRLFEFNATKETITSHKAINDLAWQVMRECQGLPLALNIIGKALAAKDDPRPWRDARDKLKNARHSEIPGMEAENAVMLHRIKISYDYLPSPCVQDCFLSCCLWPEDCSIEQAKLIECWLGLGLLSAAAGSNIDDDIKGGLGIITHLKQAHLLEPGDDEATEVRMHDMIRAMSLWISSECGNTMNKWLVNSGIGIKSKQRLMKLLQGCTPDTERMSLMSNLIEELPSLLPRCDRLKVLMLQRNTSLQLVPGSFLISTPALTYLDLSNTIIKELPAEIGLLHHLQFLNLTESYIEKLPKELSGLAQLRHLLLNGTMLLETVPYGIISKLGQLQILDMFQSRYASWGAGPGGTADDDDDRCACLDEFEARQTFLKWLGITLDSTLALRKLARCPTFSTRRLCLKRMRSPPSLRILPSNLQEVLGGFDMLESLEEFLLMSCTSLQEIIIDGSNHHEYRRFRLPMLEKLEMLSLSKLEQIRFQGIPSGKFFPQLRSVKIANCSKLKNVNFALYLPQLLHLELQFCPKMVTLIDDTATEHLTNEIIEQEDHPASEIIEQEYHTFPLLKKLTIHMLKSLGSLCSTRRLVDFPALQVVEITQCTKLTQLNIRPQGKLREIRGGEEWWRGLQWDDPRIQEQLLPYFRYVRG